MNSLPKLFSPINIGAMEVKNRIAMAPMTTNWAPADGTVSDRMIDYLEARARGGGGLIIFETVTIDENFPYILQSVGLWMTSLSPVSRDLLTPCMLTVPKWRRRSVIRARSPFLFSKEFRPSGHLQF